MIVIKLPNIVSKRTKIILTAKCNLVIKCRKLLMFTKAKKLTLKKPQVWPHHLLKGKYRREGDSLDFQLQNSMK